MVSSLIKFISCAVCASVVGSALTVSFEDEKPIDYAYVDKIFRDNHCVDCHHNGRNPSARLSLVTYERLMKGGGRGAPITANKSADSLLLKVVTWKAEPHMPPGDHPIRDEDAKTLKAWIDGGAKTSPYGEALSRYYAAVVASKWADSVKAADELEALQIKDIDTAAIAARSRIIPYTVTKNEFGWYKSARKLVDTKIRNAGVLNGIAWAIVDPKGWIKEKDLDLALKAGTMAVEDSRRQSGAILDTLAWVYFLKGDKAKAIELEKEALKCEDAQDEGTRKSLEEALKTFGG